MYSDPIVEQTRKLRDEYAARFNYDLDAIFQDLMERQQVSDRKLIKRNPKRLAHPVPTGPEKVSGMLCRKPLNAS